MTIRPIEPIDITVPDLEQATTLFVEVCGAEKIYDMLAEPISGPAIEIGPGVPAGAKIDIRGQSLPFARMVMVNPMPRHATTSSTIAPIPPPSNRRMAPLARRKLHVNISRMNRTFMQPPLALTRIWLAA